MLDKGAHHQKGHTLVLKPVMAATNLVIVAMMHFVRFNDHSGLPVFAWPAITDQAKRLMARPIAADSDAVDVFEIQNLDLKECKCFQIVKLKIKVSLAILLIKVIYLDI